jgi:hypothetical protein
MGQKNKPTRRMQEGASQSRRERKEEKRGAIKSAGKALAPNYESLRGSNIHKILSKKNERACFHNKSVRSQKKN